jgi:plasmid maintenance system antidote protein VapI
VLQLRLDGASYQAIAQAAGVSPMTVHKLVNGCPYRKQPVPCRIGSAQAGRLLAVTPEAACARRRNACGSRRRLQALVALGHSPTHLARQVGVPQKRMHKLLHGHTRIVSAAMHMNICGLYGRLWDQIPPEDSPRAQVAANEARHLAQEANWPPPMALDDDRIDDPTYHPRTAWRQAFGSTDIELSGFAR